ncbi:uncharacterized protein F4822DRAFT_393615 [Hypoxylon trugodes]|uniref:uncharacterized protein n=1 Tax=Hypoxylon trugodes TaxID=326681 RepID=UPI0021998025|nr:uncharacterized protein F4822DRAFT_393615 [Hypoxylon trugodes]KAI1390577.1 hypothetical protein F4822DRAFT_393615 [Hypoxylon trugodes]
MDPFTAFGIACNVITVVDAAIKCGKTIMELYDSTSGYTRETEALLNALGDWEAINNEMEAAESQLRQTDTHKSLQEATANCAKISRQMKDIVISCVPNTRKSFRSAMKGMINTKANKQKVTQLREQLEQSGSRVTYLVAAATRSDVTQILVRLEQAQSSHRSAIEKLDDLKDYLDPTKGNERLLEAINSINAVSNEVLEAVMHEVIVRSLRTSFPSAKTRFEAVDDAEAGTFSWIIEKPDRILDMEENLQISFAEWLRSGLGAFHIAGKPGSGKSTLMKLLATHKLTKELLRDWAGDKHLILSNFFIWRLGGRDQKTWKGLVGSLLYDTVLQTPSITKILFSGHWETGQAWLNHKANTVIHFSDSEIRAAFDKLINGPEIHKNFRICFFIDGLDEFQEPTESYNELAGRIKGWSQASSSTLKLCVSSREYPSIERVFSETQRIHLHKLTSRDINRLTQRRLCTNPIFVALRRREGPGTDVLVKRIAAEAEGVFLWVVLVVALVQEELAALGENISIRHLSQILDQVPKELEDFIGEIVKRINKHHHGKAMLLLAMALRMAGQTIDDAPPSGHADPSDHLAPSENRERLLVRDTKAGELSVLSISLYFEPYGPNETTFDPGFVSNRCLSGVHLVNTWCRGLLTVQGDSARFSHRSIPETIHRILKKQEEPKITDNQVIEAILKMVLVEIQLPRYALTFKRPDRIEFMVWLLSLTKVHQEAFPILHTIENGTPNHPSKRYYHMGSFAHINGSDYTDESILNASARIGLFDFVIWEIENNLELPEHTNRIEFLLAFATWSTLQGTSSKNEFQLVLDTCVRKWKESSCNPPTPFPWTLTWLDFLMYSIFRRTLHIFPKYVGWSLLESWLQIGLTCPFTLAISKPDPTDISGNPRPDGLKPGTIGILYPRIDGFESITGVCYNWNLDTSGPSAKGRGPGSVSDLWSLAHADGRGGRLNLKDLIVFHKPENSGRLLELLERNDTYGPTEFGELLLDIQQSPPDEKIPFTSGYIADGRIRPVGGSTTEHPANAVDSEVQPLPPPPPMDQEGKLDLKFDLKVVGIFFSAIISFILGYLLK